MKRIGKIIAALMLLALITAACSQHVCPAYSSDASTEQADVENS